MLNATPVGTHTQLASAMTASQLTMQVTPGTGSLLAPGAGNYFYITLRRSTAFEHMKVVGRVGDTLTLDSRGVDGSTAQAWASGACVSVEWTPTQLCTFVQQCMAGAPTPTGVSPQTVCMSSCKCITVAADGRITSITGGDSC